MYTFRNIKTNLVNKYTAGSNIGGLNVSVRRALNRRAVSSAGTMNKKGELLIISKLSIKTYSRNGQVTRTSLDLTEQEIEIVLPKY